MPKDTEPKYTPLSPSVRAQRDAQTHYYSDDHPRLRGEYPGLSIKILNTVQPLTRNKSEVGEVLTDMISKGVTISGHKVG